MKKLLTLLIATLFFIIVFDPADLLLGIKIPVFAMVWGVFVLTKFHDIKNIKVSRNEFIIFAIFLAVPIMAVLIGMIQNINFKLEDAIGEYKAFLFFTIVIIFINTKTDFIALLMKILTLMAICIVVLYCIKESLGNAPIVKMLYVFGNRYSIFTIGERTYAGIKFPFIYFSTAPLLVILVAYNTYKFATTAEKGKLKSFIVMLFSTFAMFITGTRNSMIFSIITMIGILYFYSNGKTKFRLFATIVLLAVFINSIGITGAFFNVKDRSNIIKMGMLSDYSTHFKRYPLTLVWGQGLGASIDIVNRRKMIVTELVYLDILRKYGIIFGLVILGGMVYPLFFLVRKKYKKTAYLLLAYISYLLMIITNPFFFSSSGMIIFALVISQIGKVANECEERVFLEEQKNLMDKLKLIMVENAKKKGQGVC